MDWNWAVITLAGYAYIKFARIYGTDSELTEIQNYEFRATLGTY